VISNENVMTMRVRALFVAFSLSGALVAHPALAQFWDSTPPNARTIGNPPTFIDTPALGVTIVGRAVVEQPAPYEYEVRRPVRARRRVYIDPDH
jgi:hypothetical protein